ncbi:MAG: 50S ribosomal protein L1 [Thaumarchaeota archaeon]|nr:50S ribosomal protein L1 [Nitrososphaerota archaeon]|tara:strand:+ start:2453 stop:3109 length:657 start_codon:yes stop_codon:yes gene_type:complete
MVTVNEISDIIKRARERGEKKKFVQSIELVITLKDIDVKKGFALNEVVNLPHFASKKASICVISSGEMALRAKKAEADRIIEIEELNRIGSNKKDAKKLVRTYDFFVADTTLMPNVGKSLGQYLGPRGKMATAMPFNAPVENLLERFRSSIRIRSKAQLNTSCKIGDESMSDADLAENALIIINIIEKKLPNGDKNIRNIMIKLTMGKTAKLVEAKMV